ncbi:MAG: hypothetical protein ACIALR_13500 [Blastopirellula sp. JB062]
MDSVIVQAKRASTDAVQTSIETHDPGEIRRHAVDLFNQQCWCWGRDVLRPEGNWLLERGFDKLQPPPERKECASSVYQLSLSRGRCVILRGFGAFYGDRELGGIFVSRTNFAPCYMSQATLDRPPWSNTDLPRSEPITPTNRRRYSRLLLGLIDWIFEYETDVADRLGLPYREETLFPWTQRKSVSIPAERFASSWRELSLKIFENDDQLLTTASL